MDMSALVLTTSAAQSSAHLAAAEFSMIAMLTKSAIGWHSFSKNPADILQEDL